jgi:hypothetical protein
MQAQLSLENAKVEVEVAVEELGLLRHVLATSPSAQDTVKVFIHATLSALFPFCPPYLAAVFRLILISCCPQLPYF